MDSQISSLKLSKCLQNIFVQSKDWTQDILIRVITWQTKHVCLTSWATGELLDSNIMFIHDTLIFFGVVKDQIFLINHIPHIECEGVGMIVITYINKKSSLSQDARGSFIYIHKKPTPRAERKGEGKNMKKKIPPPRKMGEGGHNTNK